MGNHTEERAVCPLHADETITITMTNAEQAPRLQDQLRPYCDNLRVCDSGTSPFYDIHNEVNGYNIVVDGTLRYATDYVPRMIQAIERYGRSAFVGVGGWLVMHPRGVHEIRQSDPLAQNTPVHMLDLRTIAYHVNIVGNLDKTQSPLTYMSVGVWAQKCDNEVPMISVRRPSMWVCQRANTVSDHSIERSATDWLGTWRLFKARK